MGNKRRSVGDLKLKREPQGGSHGLPRWLVVKSWPANADRRGAGSISGLGRAPGGALGNTLQSSCLEKLVDRGACRLYSTWGRRESDATEAAQHARGFREEKGQFCVLSLLGATGAGSWVKTQRTEHQSKSIIVSFFFDWSRAGLQSCVSFRGSVQ